MAKEFAVSDANRKLALEQIRAAYKGLNIDPKVGSSQLANAIGLVNALSQAGVSIPKDKVQDVLQIAYVGSNASQVRQALMPTEKQEKSATVAAELLKMVNVK